MSNEKQFSQGFTPNLPLWSFQLQKDSKLALKTRKDLEIHLITRALKNESFRAELIANPKTVIEQEIGSKLPDELEITVLEETEDTIYMVLPCNPYEGLSEEELQASLGMTYEDVALWVLDQQRNTFLDERSSVSILAKIWQDNDFKEDIIRSPIGVIEKELGEKIQELIPRIQVQGLSENANTLFIVLPKEMTCDSVTSSGYCESINMPSVVGSSFQATCAGVFIGGCNTDISDGCWVCTNDPVVCVPGFPGYNSQSYSTKGP